MGGGVPSPKNVWGAAAPREPGVWGPPLVSSSWLCTTAVTPIPRGCCFPRLEDLIPHSSTSLPQVVGPLAQSIPLPTRPPASSGPCSIL